MADYDEVVSIWQSLPYDEKERGEVAATYVRYVDTRKDNGEYPEWQEAMEYALRKHGLLEPETFSPTITGAQEYEDIIEAQAAMAETSADWP